MEISKEKLIALRKDLGWSQSRLATISGLGERTIQRIEKEGVCSLESAMALASVYELSPKDLQMDSASSHIQISDNNQKINWSGLLGLIILVFCATLIIDLTAKYSNWEFISAGLIVVLTFVFATISHGAKETISCLTSTYWIVRAPAFAEGINQKISLAKSLREYAYIVGIVSSLVCGLTIVAHTEIDPEHTADYLTYIIRPLLYSILIAEIWLNPLKRRLEYILQLTSNNNNEQG